MRLVECPLGAKRLNEVNQSQRRRLLGGLAAASVLGVAGCATRTPETVREAPRETTPPVRPRIGLALGGGAARGFAHIGVLAALEEARVQPDIVVGTSAGSLVGALYASGLDAAQLKKIALNTDESTFGEWSITSRALLRGRRIQDFVNRSIGGRPMETLPKRFAATATDLHDGRLLVLTTGDVGLAVRASAAVPMIFDPVTIDGREYVDGGLASPVPVRACRRLGAQFVIGVDISTSPKGQRTESLPDLLMQTFAIMGQHLALGELRDADAVIRPAIGDRSAIDFRAREAVIAEGERAARANLPTILQALASWTPKRSEAS